MTPDPDDRDAAAAAGALTRRQLLGAGAGLTLLATGCTSKPPAPPPYGRVLVVGGGFAGAAAARHLRQASDRVEVTLIERNPEFVSGPLSNLVLGGYRQMADLTRGYGGLAAAGVQVLQGEVTAIDAARRKLRLASGDELSWDRLIVAPGVDFVTDGVPGLAAALDSSRVLHGWRAGPQTAELRRRLEMLPQGGVYAVAIPPAPYRCPAAPYERACMVASYFKASKPRAKVLVLDANPEIQSRKALFERAFAEHYAGIVEYRPGSALREVAAGRFPAARLEAGEVRADVLNVIPPQRGGELARRAGLLNVDGRWAGVNARTMESTAVAGIHVLGDAVFMGPDVPKTAQMANQQARVAAAAIVQLLQRKPVDAAPVLTDAGYSFVTARDAIHDETVLNYDGATGFYKAAPSPGGVAVVASELEGSHAQAWAKALWADTLGA